MSTRRDGPSVLVAVASRLLAHDEVDWARAMTGELPHVTGRLERWRFALGCVGTALFLPMRRPGVVGLVVGLAVMDAAEVAWALARFAGLRTAFGTWAAVAACAAVLLLYVVAGAALARRLHRGPTEPTRTALLGGLVVALTWVGLGATTSTGATAYGGLPMLVGFPLACLAIGAVGTRRGGSAAGRRGVALAAVVAGLGCFLVWTGETVAGSGRPYDPGLLRDFHTSGAPDLATYAVSDSLGSAMMLLLVVPMLTLVLGLVGASVTGAVVRHRAA